MLYVHWWKQLPSLLWICCLCSKGKSQLQNWNAPLPLKERSMDMVYPLLTCAQVRGWLSVISAHLQPCNLGTELGSPGFCGMCLCPPNHLTGPWHKLCLSPFHSLCSVVVAACFPSHDSTTGDAQAPNHGGSGRVANKLTLTDRVASSCRP